MFELIDAKKRMHAVAPESLATRVSQSDQQIARHIIRYQWFGRGRQVISSYWSNILSAQRLQRPWSSDLVTHVVGAEEVRDNSQSSNNSRSI